MFANEERSPSQASDPRELDDLGDLYLTQGHYGDSLRAYQKAHELRRSNGDLSLEDRVQHEFRVGRLFLKLGRFEQARGRCHQGLTLLAGRFPLMRARLEALLGLIECSDGSFARARQNVDEGLRLLSGSGESLRRWRIEGLLRRTEGNLAIGLGQSQAATRAYKESHDLWQKVNQSTEARRDDRWQFSIAIFNLAEAYTFSGDYDAAWPLLDRAFAEKTDLEDRWGLAYVHLTRARIYFDRRLFEDAVREAETGREHAIAVNDPKISSRLEVQLGYCLVGTDKLPEADRVFERAQLSAQTVGHCPEMAMARVGLATVARLRDEIGAARRHLQSARAVAQQFGDAAVNFAVDIESGRLAMEEDHMVEAKECFDRALELSEKVGNAFRTMEALGEISNLEIR